MNTAARTNTPSATVAGDAARPERIHQGITGDIIGRLTKDANIGKNSTSLNIAVNVPHKTADGKGWEENTTFVSALAVGDAHKAIVANGAENLKKNAIVKLEEVPLETRAFTRADQTKDHSLEAKIFKPEQIKIEQAPRAAVPTTALSEDAAKAAVGADKAK